MMLSMALIFYAACSLLSANHDQDDLCQRVGSVITLGSSAQEAISSIQQHIEVVPDTIVALESHNPFFWRGVMCEYGDSMAVFLYIRQMHKNNSNLDTILKSQISGYLVVRYTEQLRLLCKEWRGTDYPSYDLQGYE